MPKSPACDLGCTILYLGESLISISQAHSFSKTCLRCVNYCEFLDLRRNHLLTTSGKKEDGDCKIATKLLSRAK